MKKIIFLFFVLGLLVLSGCAGITGRGVTDPAVNEKIQECVRLCDDKAHTEEYWVNSCQKILEYGGEETFNEYLKECK
ncbi:hypothetical protein A2366_01190 [Candidatus Woesebacteria bacterium RIFOXYB1_FULL_33_9]|nr:MAG: hypothetical protein A2366_01190 [Candidatus Woesebacteria bacterium RIFOXYB1_FULL_33_9]